jgi:hypothetical protein
MRTSETYDRMLADVAPRLGGRIEGQTLSWGQFQLRPYLVLRLHPDFGLAEQVAGLNFGVRVIPRPYNDGWPSPEVLIEAIDRQVAAQADLIASIQLLAYRIRIAKETLDQAVALFVPHRRLNQPSRSNPTWRAEVKIDDRWIKLAVPVDQPQQLIAIHPVTLPQLLAMR